MTSAVTICVDEKCTLQSNVDRLYVFLGEANLVNEKTFVGCKICYPDTRNMVGD